MDPCPSAPCPVPRWLDRIDRCDLSHGTRFGRAKDDRGPSSLTQRHPAVLTAGAFGVH